MILVYLHSCDESMSPFSSDLNSLNELLLWEQNFQRVFADRENLVINFDRIVNKNMKENKDMIRVKKMSRLPFEEALGLK